MQRLNRLTDLNIISHIPDNISDIFWHNILWDPIGNRIIGSKSFIRDYIFYHLNLPITGAQMSSLLRNYRKSVQNEHALLPNRIINN